jgi:hypothetical protein
MLTEGSSDRWIVGLEKGLFAIINALGLFWTDVEFKRPVINWLRARDNGFFTFDDFNVNSDFIIHGFFRFLWGKLF